MRLTKSAPRIKKRYLFFLIVVLFGASISLVNIYQKGFAGSGIYTTYHERDHDDPQLHHGDITEICYRDHVLCHHNGEPLHTGGWDSDPNFNGRNFTVFGPYSQDFSYGSVSDYEPVHYNVACFSLYSWGFVRGKVYIDVNIVSTAEGYSDIKNSRTFFLDEGRQSYCLSFSADGRYANGYVETRLKVLEGEVIFYYSRIYKGQGNSNPCKTDTGDDDDTCQKYVERDMVILDQEDPEESGRKKRRQVCDLVFGGPCVFSDI